MKIGIDAKMFLDPCYTGIPRCVSEILKVWSIQFPENEYYLFTPSPQLYLEFEPSVENWHIVVSPPFPGMRKLWSMFHLPHLIRQYEIDAFWGPNYSLPKNAGHARYYVSVYDLALLKFKSIGDDINFLKIRLLTGPSCRRAEKVITISQSTARDIEELLHIPKEKIVVSYCGRPEAKPDEIIDRRKVRKELLFSSPYFLFLSTIEPRKNIITIIKAFEEYKEKTGASVILVLAGRHGWKCGDIYEAYEKSAWKTDIIMPGFVTEDEKRYLMQHAELFLYPSLYEGFGLPILEAFEYGLPVVTTNVSSLPEVGGNCAFYLEDPKDFHELAALLDRIENLTEEERSELQIDMKKQVQLFSWEKNAVEMMSIIRNESVK